MTVTYHAGRRIQGLDSDRTGTQLPLGSVGGWVEVGRTTLGEASSTIDVTSLPDKRYYMILSHYTKTATLGANLRMNGLSSLTYSQRKSLNGAPDGTDVSQAGWYDLSGTNDYPTFNVLYFANRSANEKLGLGWLIDQEGNGAGIAPHRGELAYKNSTTSSAIDQFTVGTSTSTFATGEAVVLGWDPDDTHANNFWEELASTELTVAGDDLSSGTIPAKKYLWVQAWYKNDGAADINNLTRFNGDAGSNYTSRYSINGAADVTRTSRTWLDIESGGQDAKMLNMFIINNASNEKLVIYHQMDFGAAGAANAPNRREGVGKWANTSNQITEINLKQLDAGDYAAGSILKVWGAD